MNTACLVNRSYRENIYCVRRVCYLGTLVTWAFNFERYFENFKYNGVHEDLQNKDCISFELLPGHRPSILRGAIALTPQDAPQPLDDLIT